MLMRFFLSFIVFSFFFGLPAYGETGYVADELLITLRQGKGNQYKIVRTLKSETSFEILERGDTYFRVRTSRGEEGYVLRQYVSFKTPKSTVIARQSRELKGLKKKISGFEITRGELEQKTVKLQKQSSLNEKKLADQLAEVQDKFSQTRKQLDTIKTEYSSLLGQSEDLVNIIAERDHLAAENEKFSSRLEELKRENSNLLRTGVIKWFLAGGGVLFFGWILGKMSRKRRSSF